MINPLDIDRPWLAFARSNISERHPGFRAQDCYSSIIMRRNEPKWLRLVRSMLKQPSVADLRFEFAKLGGNAASCEHHRQAL